MGRLKAASNVEAKELTPGVSEQISTQSPIRKERVNSQPFPMAMGRRMIKYMNTIGIATLKSEIWLQIKT